MPTGVGPRQYPIQPAPPYLLQPDNSYFLVRLHNAQAFFDAGWLVKPGVLTVSSSIESSFHPGSPTHSLHQVRTLQKGVPCQLGISANLTDWLPARSGDRLQMTFKYTVVQDTPFTALIDQLSKNGLVAKVSLARPEWAVALKISEIVGRMLGYVLAEGRTHDLFALTLELNVADLKTGYYAVIGSHTDEFWPPALAIDAGGRLTGTDDDPLPRISYVVLEVLGLPRLRSEMARGEPWWELLQAGKEQALDAYPASDDERAAALKEWRATLTQVRALARKEDRQYLRKEIGELIQAAQVEVEAKLLAKTSAESAGELPPEWQAVLGVRTAKALRQAVRDYQDALDVSLRLAEQYGDKMPAQQAQT